MYRRFTAALLSVGLVASAARALRADDQDDSRAVAAKLTAAGAALFDARDAKALALTYDDDARLDVYSRDKDSGTLKIETRVGRAEIRAYYEAQFKTFDRPHARNTVEHVRRLDPDLIAFSGVFEPDSEATQPFKIPFHQLRVRRGDAWKIVNLQIFVK